MPLSEASDIAPDTLPTDSDAQVVPPPPPSAAEPDFDGLLAKFNSTVKEFVGEIQNAFPELKDCIEERYAKLTPTDRTVVEWFAEQASQHHAALTLKDASLFKTEEARFLLPDINFSLLWRCKLAAANKAAVWKYLHVLLLLVSHMHMQKALSVAATQGGVKEVMKGEVGSSDAKAELPSLEKTFQQWSHLLNEQEMSPEEMGQMREHANGMMKLMESLGNDEAIDDADAKSGSDEEDDETGAGGKEARGRAKGSTGAGGDPKAFAEKLKNDPFMKRLESSKIAQFAQELSSEMDMADLGLGADTKLDSFQDVMGAIGKHPKGLMGLVESVGNKIQTKMQKGDIQQSDLVAEAHSLMQSMQGSGAFKEMFQTMKKGKKGRGRKNGGGLPGLDPTKLLENMMKQMGQMGQMGQMPSGSAPTEGPHTAIPTSPTRRAIGKEKPAKRKGKKKRQSRGIAAPAHSTTATAPPSTPLERHTQDVD